MISLKVESEKFRVKWWIGYVTDSFYQSLTWNRMLKSEQLYKSLVSEKQ